MGEPARALDRADFRSLRVSCFAILLRDCVFPRASVECKNGKEEHERYGLPAQHSEAASVCGKYAIVGSGTTVILYRGFNILCSML